MHQTPPQNTSTALLVELAQRSIAGVKDINEDSVHSCIPDHEYAIINKGVSFVIADGVSSAEAGKAASEYATSKFVEEYFKTPDTWSVKQAGQKTLSSLNLALFKRSHEFTQQEKGYLCTFCGVVIKSRTAYFFHAGDSRLYHIKHNEQGSAQIRQVTRDHSVNIGGGKNILSRAVGMDSTLQIDFGKIDLTVGDRFLLTTDGIHDFVDSQALLTLVSANKPLQTICDELVALALAQKSDDNISCVLADLVQLPQESRDDFNAKLTRLPFPPDLSPGMSIDGYKIEKEIFASSRSQVYLVSEQKTGRQMVMKTPSINFEDDIHYIDRFIQEEWIGKRISSPYTAKIISQTSTRTCLYYLMELALGTSLDKWMSTHPLPSPKIAIHIVKQIAKALQAFHDTETIHQDLRPANIMIDEQLNIKVIDYGSVFVAGIAEIFVPLEHIGALGTATYSDPYYLLGQNTGIQGDIYALATITYELFCGQLPYSQKIEQCSQRADFDKLRYISAASHNPIIPVWFDRALEKGVSLQLTQRYKRLDDFVNDICQPNPDFLLDDPVIENSRGLMFWQAMSAFWLAMLVIVIILFSAAK